MGKSPPHERSLRDQVLQDIVKPNYPAMEKRLHTFLDKTLERYLNEIQRGIEEKDLDLDILGDADDPTHFSVRRDLLRHYRKWMVDYVKEFDETFKKELSRDLEHWPTQGNYWMRRNKKIRDRLDDPKDKVFKRVIPIMNYLWGRYLVPDESLAVQQKLGAQYTNAKGKAAPLVFVAPIDYEKMADDLGTNRVTIFKHMQELVRIGALLKFKRLGRRGNVMFAVGYFARGTKDGKVNRPIAFLRNSPEIVKGLQEYSIR